MLIGACKLTACTSHVTPPVSRLGGVFGRRVVDLTSAALRIVAECPGIAPDVARSGAAADSAAKAAKATAPPVGSVDGDAITISIAPAGSDTAGDGSAGNPFQSPVRARDAIRAVRRSRGAATPATVLVAAGQYHLGDFGALVLGADDSNTAWVATDPGAATTFAGTSELSGLEWAPTGGDGRIFTAALRKQLDFPVLFAAEESGPMLIRSRAPNGNPTDPTGMCFMNGKAAVEGTATSTSCWGISRGFFCSTPPGTRGGLCSFGAHAKFGLIVAWDPMLCPNWL